ncbi:MAG: Uncharacterised protein [Candidatus Poseidoniaceae archaeon]|nr:MAG: Uncharacterised protein [Candidatus Poseidoniaceae archaeon]
MQGDQNNQIIGEIQTPQSVAINAVQQAGMPYGAQPVQPIMQQNIMYIQMPKFRHPTRTISSVLALVGILVYILSIVFVIDSESEALFNIGYGTCCMFFNAAFVCEIVYYYNMIQHNQSYGQGIGWAITNIILAVFLILAGTLGALSIFFGI